MADVSKKNGERVNLFIPMGSTKDQPYVMIGVNGKFTKVPRGQTSNVPKEVAEEYERSQRAAAEYTKKKLRNRYVSAAGNDPLK
jgi:hypothetical protein